MVTHVTAGARAASEIAAKPAVLTAAACISPINTLSLRGTASIASVPISKTRKKNQSVRLDVM